MKTPLLSLILWLVAFSLFAQTDEIRLALLIGNKDYQDKELQLDNPENDVRLLESALQARGFEVTTQTNRDRVQMEGDFRRFRQRIDQKSKSGQRVVAFFYYSGHGVEYKGKNYLIPTTADITSADYLAERAVSLQVEMNATSETGSAVNIFCIDACRTNPKVREWYPKGRDIVPLQGLAKPTAPPTHTAGVLISFATQAKTVALDGQGSNSPYAEALAACLIDEKVAQKELPSFFNTLTGRVKQSTQVQQVPMVVQNLAGEVFYFTSPQAPAVHIPTVIRREEAAPNELNFSVGNENMAFVRVEGGTFQMGSEDGESDEKPVHSVTLSDFYMMKTEVTQAQWREVMGANPSSFKGCDNCPVEQVSWEDAQEFCEKLSQKMGKTVTLPTEAQWEYAARGGNKSKGYKYSGSNNLYEVAWYYSNSSKKTHPVATKKPNELGLYDMSGNVWEWCGDWYASDYYQNSPNRNPIGSSSAVYRVLRGGSWEAKATNCRVANRNGEQLARSYSFMGFRCAVSP